MLVGEKISLRPIKKDDIKRFFEWRNNIDIKNSALMHPFPVTLESEEDWYENVSKGKDNRFIIFSIEEQKQKTVVGYIKLFNINWIHRFCYFGIILGDSDSQGKGFGKEATKLIADYAFKTLNLKKIILEVASFNKSAINLYQKTGFVKEGCLTKSVFINNEWHDVLIMSLNRNDFKNEI